MQCIQRFTGGHPQFWDRISRSRICRFDRANHMAFRTLSDFRGWGIVRPLLCHCLDCCAIILLDTRFLKKEIGRREWPCDTTTAQGCWCSEHSYRLQYPLFYNNSIELDQFLPVNTGRQSVCTLTGGRCSRSTSSRLGTPHYSLPREMSRSICAASCSGWGYSRVEEPEQRAEHGAVHPGGVAREPAASSRSLKWGSERAGQTCGWGTGSPRTPGWSLDTGSALRGAPRSAVT